MPFPFSFSGFGCCVLTCFRQFALPFWLRDFFADSDFAAVQPASASLGALQFPWSWSWVHGLRLLTVASCLALVAEYYDWPPGGGERRPWSSQRFEVPIPFSHLLPLAAESRVLSISLVSMRVLILAEKTFEDSGTSTLTNASPRWLRQWQDRGGPIRSFCLGPLLHLVTVLHLVVKLLLSESIWTCSHGTT